MKKFFPLLYIICISFLISDTYAQGNADGSKGFYDINAISEIRLTFDDSNWAQKLDSMRLYGNSLLTADVNIDGANYSNVGVRYRESRSFKIDSKRNAFHLELAQNNPSQNHQGYNTIILSNALRDPSLVREVLSYEIARKYMIAPQANFAKLYVNGEYYGLKVNVEAVDEVFLEKHFGANDNTFVKGAPNIGNSEPLGCRKNVYSALVHESSAKCYEHNYDLISDSGWNELIELTDALNNKPKNIDEVLNIDATLWMLAFNNVLVNLSSYTGQYSQNYFLYKDDFGLFYPIVWDMNLSFGSYKNTGVGSDLSTSELYELDPFLHEDNKLKPLISSLLADPYYKKIYLAHIRTILQENFSSDNFANRAKDLQRLITVPFFNDQNKAYTVDEFNQSLEKTIGSRSKIPGVADFMKKRTSFLQRHPQISIIPPQVTDIEVFHRPKYSNQQVKDFRISTKVEKLPNKVFLFYRFNENQPYQKVLMKDDGNSADGEAGDGIFGAIADPRGKYADVEFYIVTENLGAVNFYPQEYMFQPYTANLEELNK